ncbi:DEAD/DEAH box helicase [Deefgea salmonis]|uniref:DEAD/DEAH box helicase family protein n=1 Tax=Deefgea salmonis TaxID=2875502 RepID=A0ABS8BKP8_9NEIS|nr:DEAD/DEAH box helicase family protein [Deefgea salmonis]MCB5196177.1 DEAD/DEAH box helicase family protein [Deefgea salmonis]
MELNSYQTDVIVDLRSFLAKWQAAGDVGLAYRAHWDAKGVAKMRGYQPAAHGAPQICAKVPTAGGKTFIGVHALAACFDSLQRRQGDARLCIWLVPSTSIHDQVINAFQSPQHPYRLGLNQLFEGRVTVLDKAGLLAGFSSDDVRDGVVVAVLTYASLRAKNKDDRKLYQENGALADFDGMALDEAIDPASLVAAMAGLNPVIIVDESHNATTPLSNDMLKHLNPALVLELTATPRDGANLVSAVGAMALREQHMVKLPVIVRNLADQDAVIAHAIDLRARLEAEAQFELTAGGTYIRPIVLLQAESKTADDRRCFESVKADLLSRGIPQEQIAIKTAKIDELKGIVLAASDCQIRFIITINALKEGWDCPFAYILATLADRSSPVDVEQILGRILRQPAVRLHGQEALNMSYVLTASSVFSTALEKIVAGLNRAGFSRLDYRTPDLTEPLQPNRPAQSGVLTKQTELPTSSDYAMPVVAPVGAADSASPQYTQQGHIVESSDQQGLSDDTVDFAAQAYAEMNAQLSTNQVDREAPEIMALKNEYAVRPEFATEIAELRIPQFFYRLPGALMLDDERSDWAWLERDHLIGRDFKLANCSVQDFVLTPSSGDLVKLDLHKVGEHDYEATRVRLKDHEVRKLKDYLSMLDTAAKVAQVSGLVGQWVGKMPPLAESDIRAYIGKILTALSPSQLDDVLEQQQAYVETIKKRIKQEMADWSLKRFKQLIASGEIETQGQHRLPVKIHPLKTLSPSENSLYLREEVGNNLENRMAELLAGLDNVAWWHRNSFGKTGFMLNGPVQHHYPDFIVKMKNGRLLLIETKGGDRDNTDSAAKIALGGEWEKLAGREYRYFMVFETNALAGALSWAGMLEVLNKM